MIRQLSFKDYIEIANIHAKRLQSNLKVIQSFVPLTAHAFKQLTDEQVQDIDGTIIRFVKLQDTIGNQIFPRILNTLSEDAVTFIDKLHKLEKIGYLPSADWWKDLRDLRNNLTHDYPNDYEALAQHFKEFTIQAPQLLSYWKELHKKISSLISL